MLEEIYSTKDASIAQRERSNSFILSYEDEEIAFKLCDLYALRHQIMAIDVVELLDSHTPDIEIVYLAHCDKLWVLSTLQVLQFRELLNGTFDILALNSQIQKIFRRNVFNF
ncbi:MAG: hypothetical protein AAF789_01500 [Bacteroidota bacterium]